MTSSAVLKRLLATCILTNLIFIPVETYTCTSSSCHLDKCDAGRQTTCETSHGCFNNRQESVVGKLRYVTKEKGCSSGTCFPVAFTATLGINRTFVYEHQCCQNEQCNQEDIEAHQKSSELNGVVCPSCFNEYNLTCEQVLLPCTGAETKCMEVIGSAHSRFVIYGKGCATESACNLKGLTLLSNIDIRTYCEEKRSGSPRLTAIASSTLAGLVLLNILL